MTINLFISFLPRVAEKTIDAADTLRGRNGWIPSMKMPAISGP